MTARGTGIRNGSLFLLGRSFAEKHIQERVESRGRRSRSSFSSSPPPLWCMDGIQAHIPSRAPVCISCWCVSGRLGRDGCPRRKWKSNCFNVSTMKRLSVSENDTSPLTAAAFPRWNEGLESRKPLHSSSLQRDLWHWTLSLTKQWLLREMRKGINAPLFPQSLMKKLRV